MTKGKKSQDSAQAKGKFLVDMSHEIQNSMKIILSRSDLLKQTNLSHKQTEYIDTIYESARRLSWIVNDMLDFSKMEMGTIKLQSINFNLEYLINDVFQKVVKQKKDHPVETYIDIDKNVPKNLIGDPTRLRQVLANLLSNAFKCTLKGEVGIIVQKVKNNLEIVRVGFTASKKVGNAIARNRAKRRMRSLVEEMSLNVGFDYVLIARKGILDVNWNNLVKEVS